jgi:hypothetical protein
MPANMRWSEVGTAYKYGCFSQISTAGIILLLTFFQLESPRFYIKQGKREKALEVLCNGCFSQICTTIIVVDTCSTYPAVEGVRHVNLSTPIGEVGNHDTTALGIST